MSLAPSIKSNFIELIQNTYKGDDKKIQEFIELVNKPDGYGKLANTHITVTAFVIDEEAENALILHHKKYNKWLAFGGHWNDSGFSQETIQQGAIREMLEEGFNERVINFNYGNNGNPINLDIHQAADHIHYDVAFLVKIDKNEPFDLTKESKSTNWINLHAIAENRNNLFNDRLSEMAQTALVLENKPLPTTFKKKKFG